MQPILWGSFIKEANTFVLFIVGTWIHPRVVHIKPLCRNRAKKMTVCAVIRHHPMPAEVSIKLQNASDFSWESPNQSKCLHFL